MEVGYCSKCEFKTPIQKTYGVVYRCDKECTHMDVTYFTREKHEKEKNNLCPLLTNKESSEETVWNFFKDKGLDYHTPAAIVGDVCMKSKKGGSGYDR